MKVIAWLLISIIVVFAARVALGVVPAVLDVTLTCDARPTNEQVRAYRFYERIGTNWTFLGSVVTNRFTVTNVNVLVPHTYGVTASNVFGESDMSVPVIAPTDPRPPSNLGVVQVSLLTKANSTIAGSTDLVTWQEKQTFQTTTEGLRVTFKVQPRERVQFWKEWTAPLPPLPGLPAIGPAKAGGAR